MLKENLSARFRVLDILLLPGLLLHEFAWHQKAHDVVHYAHAQPVARGKVPFIRSRESRGISPVGIVCEHRRIEITIRMEPLAACRKPLCFPRIRNSRRAIHGGETSTARIDPPVPSSWCIFFVRDFHYATPPPPT